MEDSAYFILFYFNKDVKTLDEAKHYSALKWCEGVLEADSKEKLVSQPMTLPKTQGAVTRQRAEGLLDLRAGSD